SRAAARSRRAYGCHATRLGFQSEGYCAVLGVYGTQPPSPKRHAPASHFLRARLTRDLRARGVPVRERTPELRAGRLPAARSAEPALARSRARLLGGRVGSRTRETPARPARRGARETPHVRSSRC